LLLLICKTHYLEPKAILNWIQTTYLKYKNGEQWKPALRKTDSARVPAGISLATGTTIIPNDYVLSHADRESLMVLYLNMVQTYSGSNPKSNVKKTPQNFPCNTCGQIGHWSPECPLNKNSKSSSSSANTKKNSNDSNKSWRRQAPANKVKNVRYYWCKMCNLWSKTHGSKEHGYNKSNTSSDSKIAANLVLDPSKIHPFGFATMPMIPNQRKLTNIIVHQNPTRIPSRILSRVTKQHQPSYRLHCLT
jgi:hypothetical protein